MNNNTSQIYNFNRWILIKKRLNQVCMRQYSDDLLDCLKTLLPENDVEMIEVCIKTWINQQVGPAITHKIKNNMSTKNGDLWADTLTLFSEPKKMAKAISYSYQDIATAWKENNQDKAYRYLWTVLSRHFSNMRHISEICGPHKSKNWMIIERCIREIQMENIDSEKVENFKNPVFIAPLVLERCQSKLRDIETVKAILSYIYAFSPQESIDLDFKLFDYTTHTRTIADLLMEYLEQDNTTLTYDEKEAIQLKYFKEIRPMTDKQFMEERGYSRSTHKNRLKSALKKLNIYLSKYVTGVENV